MLGLLHAGALWVAVGFALALGLLAAADLATGRLHRLALDRLILGVIVSALVGGLTGVALLMGGSRPADPLHVLYGVAAPLVVALARWLGARPDVRRRAGWLLLGAAALGGVLLRLATTGA